MPSYYPSTHHWPAHLGETPAYFAWCQHWDVTPTSEAAMRARYFGKRDDDSPEIKIEWAAKLAHRRGVGPTLHHGEIYDYASPIDGEQVVSRHQHHEHMRKHNVIEMGSEVPKPREETPFDWKNALGETYAELKVTGKIDD